MTQANKIDRFAVYNANLRKSPQITSDYPRMLTSPDDGATTIVQDAEEHEKLVGSKKFETAPLWGPSAKAKNEPQKASQASEAQPNEVVIPENSRQRKGLRTQSLDGKSNPIADLVPAQTVFDTKPPSVA